MSYVVLHIDLDFIVGTVCTDDGNYVPITNGNDDLLWLYFFNDPHANAISFGKKNQSHFNNNEINYYGNFFELIENSIIKFKKGEFQKDAIELLDYSNLLQTIKNKYKEITLEDIDSIPLLLTFSLSISELAKQKTVEYLKSKGFKIDSYTIPLSELTCYYPFSKNIFIPVNGSNVLLLEATNTSLNLMRLVFSDNYFMLDSKTQTYEGMGIDPRKRALVGYVINQINTSVGALDPNQIIKEIAFKEFKAEEWLKKIDAKSKNDNSPVKITDSLSLMPNSKRDVLVKKSDIETFTNDFVNLLMDYYHAYKSDNLDSKIDVTAIFLLGDCFKNSLVKDRFKKLISTDKLFIYDNKDIQDILSVYPKIDFERYISEEGRIKAKAIAEEQKQAEQRALEDKKQKELAAEEQKKIATEKAEKNRKEAIILYERAVELDKEGKLQDALANAENAILLDKENNEYKVFVNTLKNKIKELHEKTEKYKSWLKDAETYEQAENLKDALNAYEYAQGIFDSSELRKKIVETKNKIAKQEKTEKINSFISIAIALSDKGKFDDAIINVNKALEVDPLNKSAKDALQSIYALQTNKETEKKYKETVSEADRFFKEESFDKAIEKYNEALRLKLNDKYCSEQIEKIKEFIHQKHNTEKAQKIVEEADLFFEKELWNDAKTKYEDALKLCANDNKIINKISKCSEQIKAIQNKFQDLLFEATVSERKNKLKEALEFLKKAEKLQPTDIEIKERIKKINNQLKFADFGKIEDTKNHTNNNFDFKSSKPELQDLKKDDDFLGIGNKNKSTNEQKDDDFLGIPKKKEKEATNKTKKKTDFDNW